MTAALPPVRAVDRRVDAFRAGVFLVAAFLLAPPDAAVFFAAGFFAAAFVCGVFFAGALVDVFFFGGALRVVPPDFAAAVRAFPADAFLVVAFFVCVVTVLLAVVFLAAADLAAVLRAFPAVGFFVAGFAALADAAPGFTALRTFAAALRTPVAAVLLDVARVCAAGLRLAAFDRFSFVPALVLAAPLTAFVRAPALLFWLAAGRFALPPDRLTAVDFLAAIPLTLRRPRRRKALRRKKGRVNYQNAREPPTRALPPRRQPICRTADAAPAGFPRPEGGVNT